MEIGDLRRLNYKAPVVGRQPGFQEPICRRDCGDARQSQGTLRYGPGHVWCGNPHSPPGVMSALHGWALCRHVLAGLSWTNPEQQFFNQVSHATTIKQVVWDTPVIGVTTCWGVTSYKLKRP